MSIRVLVTGANGFVGQSLCATLLKSGHTVVRAVRSGDALPRDSNYVVVGSINQQTDWSTALNNVDVLIHLAGRVHVVQNNSVDSLAEFRSVNVEGTLNLARQALVAGVKRFVFLSSIKVNGEITNPGGCFTENDVPDPRDAYGLSKYEAEEGLRQLFARGATDLVIIRPPLVYGVGVKANFASLIRVVQNGWPLPLGAIHNLRSFVALDNLVDFIVTCLAHPQAVNQTFLVSDGYDLSTPELIRGLARETNVTARLVPVPVWALRVGAVLIGKSDAAQRLCGNLQVDISKARSFLGWTPPISVEEGLHRAVTETC